MKVELFPFQKKALADIRMKTAEAMGSYHRTHAPQVVSFTAPTGAGKTIIMSAFIENVFYGDDAFAEQPNAIIVWLSDSPQLNEQSKLKIDAKADKIRLSQCVTVTEDSFDRETFEDGHIYFLNTQKLSVSSKLTKHGDGRTYTIWETLSNTVRDKSDRLYFIIDEAHRGMQGRDASKATTIMQKFIKGSDSDNLPPMPVVIGMSATTQRFNALVEGTSSTIHKSIVTAEEVRASGLLKDRIVITYPEEASVNNDMAILQAAADDWKEKWDHWTQYCFEQHYAYVNPVFVIQVLNGSGTNHTDTDLSDCIAKIEERTGFKFDNGQVVHTFGDTNSALHANGLEVNYIEPSRIADDKNIRVVFFKENLSTGWDCPRAETMMSFKHASDATYIAQLLGRMVRTPMQMHIQVDDVLNDVHLFLPYFNEDTVKSVVDALQSTEGGTIPTDIYGEAIGDRHFETLTVKTKKKDQEIPGQMSISDFPGMVVAEPHSSYGITGGTVQSTPGTGMDSQQPTQGNPSETAISHEDKPSIADNTNSETVVTGSVSEGQQAVQQSHSNQTDATRKVSTEEPTDGLFDREEVMKYINDLGLLSYDVRSLRINDYLKSLFRMAHLLSISRLYREAVDDVKSEISNMIHSYIKDLKDHGKYDDLVKQVKQFKLASQIFDAFGESVDNYYVHDLFSSTDTDIDRQFLVAETKLGREGIGYDYGNKFMAEGDMLTFKVDVILFVADESCMNKLYDYAKDRFHGLVDKYRRYIATVDSEKIRKEYDNITSDGDVISKHNFRLPETIQVPHEPGGKAYRDHLFVSDTSGTATMKFNTWESGVIEEEEKRDDFVCWIRNPSRGSWALSIPYEIDGVTKPAYPDFIIVRKDPVTKYVIDILEPHRPDLDDNIGKAKGFAQYAKQNPGLGRIQIIRKSKDAAGNDKFRRLDFNMSSVREKVLAATNNDELDHIFDIDGFFD